MCDDATYQLVVEIVDRIGNYQRIAAADCQSEPQQRSVPKVPHSENL
jgi:hypothetical protein